MIPLWLMPSRVKVFRPQSAMVDGVLTVTMEAVDGLDVVPMRLEVGLYRPGKDQPLPIQAGRAPDRVAVYWCSSEVDLRPGDHLEMVVGPVTGSWHVRNYPDRVGDLATLHHLEGQCIEVVGQRGDV